MTRTPVMVGIGDLREVEWPDTITVLPCFSGYPTVLLCIIGPNSWKASLSQLLHGMKKRIEFKMLFSDRQEAANLTISQRKMSHKPGNSKEAKGLHFHIQA